MECGACGGTNLEPRGRIDYYTDRGRVETDLVRCETCGTWIRVMDASAPHLIGHFSVASYTDLDNEARLWRSRKKFFRFLWKACERELCESDAGRSLLDIGCSYGHMMDIFTAKGYQTVGVEIVDFLHDHLRRKGHLVYPSLSDVPASMQFDVVALVDSLYYVDQPVEILSRTHKRLKEHGVLLLRVTNRTPMLDLCHRLHRPITSAVFGDSKFSFSARGIRAVCGRAGFRIHRVVLFERGKQMPLGIKSLYYWLSPLVSRLGRIVSPGIVLLCMKGEHVRG